ncbi:MAG: ATP-binding protein [Candidatus Dormiibacterota bacterium]
MPAPAGARTHQPARVPMRPLLIGGWALGLLLLVGAGAAGALMGAPGSHDPWVLALLCAALVAMVAGIAGLQLRLRRLARDRRVDENRELELTAEREALVHLALEAADRERQRLAADLHDGVIQLVSAVTLRCATVARSLHRDSAKSPEHAMDAAASLDRITVDLQAVTADLRTLMGALAGDEIESDGLNGALSALLLPLAESGVRVDLSVGELACDSAVRTLVHRGAQELIRNAAKHAAAKRVVVSVSQDAGGVRLRFQDDGRGFDPRGLDERRHLGHLGLRLLDQRIRDAGGELRIETAPGRGTLAEVTLPPGAPALDRTFVAV